MDILNGDKRMEATAVEPRSSAVVLAELQRIYKRHRKLLKAEDVLDAARHPDSPLHAHFEWDDTIAAEQFRLHQARQLIVRYRVEVIESKPSRVFYSLSQDRINGGGYRATEDILKGFGPEAKQTAALELQAWARRHELFHPQLVEAVRKVAEKF